jgi:uncharacterized integral membrane protein
VRWGNVRGQSRFLPRTGWTWLSTVEAGYWRHLEPIPVDIPATPGLDRGVWFRIRQGIRGLLVPDERGLAVVYMICEPASHYYHVMTRSNRMPVLIEERIRWTNGAALPDGRLPGTDRAGRNRGDQTASSIERGPIMRIIQAILFLAFLAAVGLFAVQNTRSVTVDFWKWELTAPVAIVIVAIYFLGMLSGWTVVAFVRRSIRRVGERPSESR